jgi:hypothetical protein
MAAAAPRREETWLPVERDRALAIRLGPAEARGKLEGADDAPVHADSQDMRVEQKVVGPAQQQAIGRIQTLAVVGLAPRDDVRRLESRLQRQAAERTALPVREQEGSAERPGRLLGC